jgi:hypothetical protein
MKARHLSTVGAALLALSTWCVAQCTTTPNSSGTTAPASGQQTGNQTEDPNTHGGPAATTQSQGGSSATVNTQGSAQTQAGGTNAQASTNTNASAQEAGHTQVGVVGAVLDKSIDSSKVKEGDQVTAKTTSDYSANGQVLIPKDSKLIGHVTKASAKSKGAAQSELAIMFDKAVLKKNKQEVPVQTIIQAFAAPQQVAMPQSDQSEASSPAGGGVPQPSGGGGGMVGGVANAAGNTVGAVGQTAGGAVGAAGNAAGGAVQGTANATNGVITAGSQGVLNINGLTLDTQNSSVAQGTLLTSEGKNVKLESGTQMVVRIAESTSNQ